MLTIPEEIRNLLHIDGSKKNIRIHFTNAERSDICNDMIIKDSVKLTESLCSQETLKFGLCESPVFECSVVGMENMKGATIEVFNEVYCEASVEGAVFRIDLQAYVYPIPYGTFTVSECKRDADMQYRKIQAYGNNINEGISEKEKYRREFKTTSGNYPYSPDVFIIAAEDTITSRDPSWEATQNLTHDDFNYFCDSLNPSFEQYQISIGLDIVPCYEFAWYESSQEYLAGVYEMYTYEQLRDVALDYLRDKISDDDFSRIRDRLNTFCHSTGFIVGNHIDDEDSQYVMGDFTKSIYFKNGCLYLPLGFSGDSTIAAVNSISIYGYNPGIGTETIFKVMSNPHIIACNIDNLDIPSYTYEIARTAIKWGNDSCYVVPDNAPSPRQLITSALELMGLFMSVGRYGGLKTLSIMQQFNQTPSDILYPNTDTYPQGGVGGKLLPEDYQSCWYDDYYSKPIGKIRVQYRNTSNVDCLYELYLSDFSKSSDVGSYQTYDFTNNEIIKSLKLTESQIEEFCETIASNIEGVTYMPVEFTGRGLPYVEPGDTFEILTKSNDSITTIVLNRTLSGEQVLTDTYKSN